ncbi:hypothetical protein ACLIA0_05760 [Bacillaceae bacterium W0354]
MEKVLLLYGIVVGLCGVGGWAVEEIYQPISGGYRPILDSYQPVLRVYQPIRDGYQPILGFISQFSDYQPIVFLGAIHD